ncbi:MAG: adenine-specific methyltransferase EcoRI family protein [Bacteroidaceae bacterium]|nr:adenine-specific methyltransferase EcoRI family protein [Bacteroidaceae bacterium]
MANKNLNKAKEAKKDEFYTQLEDINNEMRHYREHFRGKTVLCNCDDPRVSNFFTYFAYNFEYLGLKKLITTCYKNQDMDLFSTNKSEQAVYLIYEGDKNGNRIPDVEEIGVQPLKGDGDFRSAECVELLKEADIVVTNPPFSLFREFVAQLMAYDKKFLIIGNVNALSYKEIFPLIQSNRMWFGASIHSGDRKFWVPDDYGLNAAGCGIDETGRKYIRVKGVRWFTNLDYKERHEDLILYKLYAPEEYPRYVNYDAIEVSRTEYIPCDYDGVMGVPITFIDKYNPDQFEIIGIGLELANMDIIRKRLGKLNGGPRLYLDKDGELVRLYERILIRKIQR